MIRRLFTAASVLSLLIAVAFTAFWIASYHGYFGLSVVDDTHLEDSRWQDYFIDRGKAGTVSAEYDGGMSNLESFENPGHHRKWTFFGRRLFAIASVISMLLSATALALWVRSVRYVDGFVHVGRSHTYEVTSHLGVIQVAQIEFPAIAPEALGSHTYSAEHNGDDPFWSPYLGLGRSWRAAGFEARTYKSARPTDSPNGLRWLIIPDWAIALAFAVPPAAWLLGPIRMARRIARGHCARCGYDLRASKSRCPECGTATASILP